MDLLGGLLSVIKTERFNYRFVIPFSSNPLCTVSSNDNNGLSYIEGLELIELSTTQYRVNRQNNACNDWFMFAQGY